MSDSKNSRFVAYFDMLGMKTATLRNQDVSWKALCSINEARKAIYKKGIEIANNKEKIGDRVQAIIFSDSVIIFSFSDTDEDLLALLVYSSEFFKDGLSQSVPLRGGIAHGDFFFSFEENLFLGNAFVKAYVTGECAQWYGITIEEEVYNRSKKLSVPFGTKSDIGIVEYNIPVKKSRAISIVISLLPCRKLFYNLLHCKKGYALNWPGIFRNNFKKIPENSKELYGVFKYLFGEYNDLRDDVKQKHINTYNFVKVQLKNN